jgi:SAM-dependent methyltransferase
MSDHQRRRPVRSDYDTQPDRFHLARDVLSRHGGVADVHAAVAARFVAEERVPVLDVGCGEGELARYLPAGAWAGVDASPTMVAGAPPGARLGQADSLPFAAGSFGGVALLYVLYHLEDPACAERGASRWTPKRPGRSGRAEPARLTRARVCTAAALSHLRCRARA